jgi:hypothetical protein
MTDEQQIRIGRNEHGLYVSRRSPRFHMPIPSLGFIFPAGAYSPEERLYLYPDGLWRTACVMIDGLSGYFPDPRCLVSALMPALAELGRQTGRTSFKVRFDLCTDAELSRVVELLR